MCEELQVNGSQGAKLILHIIQDLRRSTRCQIGEAELPLHHLARLTIAPEQNTDLGKQQHTSSHPIQENKQISERYRRWL